MECSSLFIYVVIVALGYISSCDSVAIFSGSIFDLNGNKFIDFQPRLEKSHRGSPGRGGPQEYGRHDGPQGHGGPLGHEGPPGQPFGGDSNEGLPDEKPGRELGHGKKRRPKGKRNQPCSSGKSDRSDQSGVKQDQLRISEIKYQQYVAKIFPEDDTDYSLVFNGRTLARPGQYPHMCNFCDPTEDDLWYYKMPEKLVCEV